MVSTGLSEVMGSWNTMAMRRPRTLRISASLSARMSKPMKRMWPPTTRPGGSGMSRRIASALTALPQPDSPTLATVSPWFTDSAPGSTPIAKRPGLQDALAQLGPDAVLVVYRLDRLARDLELQIRLFRIVTSAGARIVSTMDEGTINGPGEDDPDAEFLRNLPGALAQRERRGLAPPLPRGPRAHSAQGPRSRRGRCA